MILIVTGGRYYRLTYQDFQLLSALNPSRIFAGDASGADECALEWAAKHGVETAPSPFEADWDTYGLGAGPRRNEEMIRYAIQYADSVENYREEKLCLLAFPGNRGTWDCVNKAQRMGIPVMFSYDVER